MQGVNEQYYHYQVRTFRPASHQVFHAHKTLRIKQNLLSCHTNQLSTYCHHYIELRDAAYNPTQFSHVLINQANIIAAVVNTYQDIL